MVRKLLCAGLTASLVVSTATASEEDDPYLWLEEVESEEALAWAGDRSKADTAVLEAVPEFEAIHGELREIYTSKDRIPRPTLRGDQVYNFWQDDEHVRGIWRRASLAEFSKDQPAWEIVLDLDALAEAEDENWVWKGANCLEPEHRHCLVSLSRGGADARVVREFDTQTGAFVEGGFELPEAKHRIDWRDANTLWVGTDFGAGSLTTSGYPRFVKTWERGTPLTAAETLFEASVDDTFVLARSEYTLEGRYDLVTLVPEFFRGIHYLVLGGRLVRLDLPEDVQFRGFFEDRMLISLRSDWQTGGRGYPQGALLAIDLDKFLAGSRAFDLLFEPTEKSALRQVGTTRDHVLVTTLDNVRGRLFRLGLADGAWSEDEVELPGMGLASIVAASESTNEFFFSYDDFVTPSTLYLASGAGEPGAVKVSPAWFDSGGMTFVQHEAVSKDGTRIPYFLFTPDGFEADGQTPTLLYAYGGFELSSLPNYRAGVGKAWVGRGGAYVVANIRGGGEFGPKWHQAALKENRQRNFDDFIAVAEDLVERKVTSPEHLGIIGGSQGGLLVGGAFVQRPDLFNAVVSAVPLFDMKRYNKLLAGASWMAEYGNPDTDDWEYMRRWSPYQNLVEDADYPEVFFWTNTRDDRVHPGHARKAVRKMADMGHRVFYYENTEGGHSGGTDPAARAYTDALEYAYFWMKLRR